MVRDDKIVYEWYAPGHGPDRKQGTASLAKAIVGGIVADGRAAGSPHASRRPRLQYIPAWRNDPQKSRITIRQLATHTSGIEDAEQDDDRPYAAARMEGRILEDATPDPFSIAITRRR